MGIKASVTTRQRFSGFFVLLSGVSLIVCLFTLIGSTGLNRRYEKVVRQMMYLNDYYGYLEACGNSLKQYVAKENPDVFEQVRQYLSSMEQVLEAAETSAREKEVRRELQDLTRLTGAYRERAEQTEKKMKQYQTSDIPFLNIRRAYEAAVEVYETIEGEYSVVNRMVLEAGGNAYRSLKIKQQELLTVLICLYLGCFAVVYRQILILSKMISDPVFALTRKAEEIKKGLTEQVKKVKDFPQADEDMKLLIEVFNDMIEKLRAQIETIRENARVRQLLQESRYKELQMQINPHFLFNTLNMISENAYLEGAENTVDLLGKTARLFRFSLNFSGRSIPLFEELEALGDYVFIQEQRFENRIRFCFDLDESFHNVRIPSLILQPLVENAVTHGIGGRTGSGVIWIRTYREKETGCGCIEVEDNGRGMDEETLAAVRKNMEHYQMQEGSTRIGLGNVCSRLKIYFRGAAGMQVESRRNEGTKITISLPGEILEHAECAGDKTSYDHPERNIGAASV